MDNNESEKIRAEINHLYNLLYERDREFEKAKLKRMIITIIVFTIGYAWLLWHFIDHKDTSDYLMILILSIVAAWVHFWVNLTIFSQLCQMGKNESESLEYIRKRIRELEKDLPH